MECKYGVTKILPQETSPIHGIIFTTREGKKICSKYKRGHRNGGILPMSTQQTAGAQSIVKRRCKLSVKRMAVYIAKISLCQF